MGRRQERCLLPAPRLRLPLCRPSVPRSSPDRRAGSPADYGEDRYRLFGTIEGRAYVVVYTVRGSAIRIISARKANAKEVADYEHNTRQD